MTVTISVVAGSQPNDLIAAAGRMQTSITNLDVQIALQQLTLAQLSDNWQNSAADAAVGRAEKNVQQQLELQSRLERMQSALNAGGGELSGLRAPILNTAAQATSLGGLVSDVGASTGNRLGSIDDAGHRSGLHRATRGVTQHLRRSGRGDSRGVEWRGCAASTTAASPSADSTGGHRSERRETLVGFVE